MIDAVMSRDQGNLLNSIKNTIDKNSSLSVPIS